MKKQENVKAGETYYVRTKVLSIEEGYTDTEIAAVVVDAKGKSLGPDVIYFSKSDLAAFSSSKLETTPKYDPCREYREGDIVRVAEWNGRLMFNEHGKVFKCVENEYKNGLVPLKMNEDDITHLVHACHLELVTPVEEREPYSVKESIFIKDEWQVWKDGGDETQTLIATYTLAHPNAKAAAEAERDRLNAEWRKENA